MAITAAWVYQPDTWGSVSDWCMVVVTIVTAVYLYRTLQSQKEVQSMQAKLFKIESIRFRESIKPSLEYSAVTDMFSSTDGSKILTVKVTNSSESVALDISRTVPTGENAVPILIATGMADIKNI